MKWGKIIAIGLAVAMCITLSACRGSGDSVKSEKVSNNEETAVSEKKESSEDEKLVTQTSHIDFDYAP